MTQPFDHPREDWYPPGLCSAAVVCTSSGTPRPALRLPLKEFVVHYGGAGSNWTDLGDTAQELANIELNHARPNNKPNEYNSVSDSAAETWEYSGPYRSAGNGAYNMTTWSHLALYGLENLTEAEAQGLIAGIRRARAQCVAAGYLTADHVVRPHNFYLKTSCPGPLWTNKRWWNQIIAPLEPLEKPVNIYDLIWAGIDWNGKDYNDHDWIIPASGGGLVLQPDLSVRTASIRDDVVVIGAHNGYTRPQTRGPGFRVPFEVSGEIFIHDRMDDVVLIPQGVPPHWNWGVNFHPVFVDEDNNSVTGFSPTSERWSASGQIDKTYGLPYVERFRAPVDHDTMLGAWHRWRMAVPAVGVHEVYWDDRLVYRVVEKDPPAKFWGRPINVALRLDFYDVSLKFDPLPGGSLPPPAPTNPEEEEIMIAYIAQPPVGLPNNPPWLLCLNGSVRYATNVDTTYAIDNGWAFIRLNLEQYNLLLKGANLA